MATIDTDVAAGARPGNPAAVRRRLGGHLGWVDATEAGHRSGGVAGVLVVGLLVAVMVAGCGSDGQESPEPTWSAVVPAPAVSESPADPAAEALAAYEAMWGVYDEVAQDSQADPEDAGLERYARGDALATVTDLVGSLRENGLVAEGSIDHAPRVTELEPAGDPTSARVEDCADTSDRSVVRADGGPYEDDPGGPRLIFADVEAHEGVWQVTALGIGQVGSCQR